MKQNNTEELVILVDEQDRSLGVMGKMEAHQKGLLHRAISVFIINSKGEWLLQQRSFGKYHSGGLLSNTCCSHPKPGETAEEAAKRRLMEEMGMETELRKLFCFTYRANLDHNLTENEYDHVFIGETDELPKFNPKEVQSWKYLSFSEIKEDANNHPETYAVWFLKIMDRVQQDIQN